MKAAYTACDRATWISGSCMEASKAGSRSKPSLLAKRIHLSTLSGSSRKVSLGGKGVRMIPFLRSVRPYYDQINRNTDKMKVEIRTFPVKSSTEREWTLKKSVLIVMSLRSASCNGVPKAYRALSIAAITGRNKAG